MSSLPITADNPQLAAVLAELEHNPEPHADNRFVHDVVGKFKRFGSISEAQLNALERSLARDTEKATEKAEPKGPAPQGRVQVSGRVLSLKEQGGIYGLSVKMLLKLENNSKVWVSVPKGATVKAGDNLNLVATFTVSDTDPSFAFGTRPQLVTAGSAVEGIPLTYRLEPAAVGDGILPSDSKPSALAELLAELEV